VNQPKKRLEGKAAVAVHFFSHLHILPPVAPPSNSDCHAPFTHTPQHPVLLPAYLVSGARHPFGCQWLQVL
jgi:hypothetical protein